MDRTLLIAIALLAGGCHELQGFACATDTDCTLSLFDSARCEADSRCSYPDDSCSSGYAYGDAAGDESNRCVDDGSSGTGCAIAVRAGLHDTCVLERDNTVVCFGDGMLEIHPTLPAGTFAQIDVSTAGLCARYDDHSLACAAGPTTGAIDYPALDLSIGGSHLCAVSDTSFAACWGTNTMGQLGNGSTDPSPTPSGVLGLFDVKQISAGLDSTCAINNSGPLWCWGDNTHDQLGQGVASVDQANSPISVNAGAASIYVSVGDQFACVVIDGGDVLCWGDNTMGQIGQGSTTATIDAATKVTGLSHIVQVTAGGSHACARDRDGMVWCWGSNGSHESSASASAAVLSPELVVDDQGAPVQFRDVDAGALHTCGVRQDGIVVCWGSNAEYQLGDGTMVTATTPVYSAIACPMPL